MGRVYIFDSQTHQVVRTIQNREPGYDFHMQQVEVIPDVDGDAKPELLVGTVRYVLAGHSQTPNDGRVIVRSLQSGAVLYELLDPNPSPATIGMALAGIGDITGDGIGDIAVGAPWKENFAGVIQLYSGADGRWLRTIRSPKPRPSSTNGGRFGRRIEVLPDLNGDNVAELWTQEDGGTLPLFTYVFDGATSALLRTIQYPGNAINPFGGPRYYIGTVRQEAPPGIRAYLFGLGHLADGAGRVYFMPFTPLPKPPRLKPLGASHTGFRLQVIGESGSKLEVQGTEDFKMWKPVATVTMGNQPVEAEDSTATTQPQRFYRAVQRE